MHDACCGATMAVVAVSHSNTVVQDACHGRCSAKTIPDWGNQKVTRVPVYGAIEVVLGMYTLSKRNECLECPTT